MLNTIPIYNAASLDPEESVIKLNDIKLLLENSTKLYNHSDFTRWDETHAPGFDNRVGVLIDVKQIETI